jgi:hypothetical protein
MSRGSGGRKRSADGTVVIYDAYQCLTRCRKAAKISVPALDKHVLGETLRRLAVSAAVDASRQRSDEVARWRQELDRREHELGVYLTAISAVDVGEAAFAKGARARRAAIDESRKGLAAAELRARRGGGAHRDLLDWLPDAADGEANPVLRTLIGEVTVRKSGQAGRRGDLSERVRILWADVDEPLENTAALGKRARRKRKPIAA